MSYTQGASLMEISWNERYGNWYLFSWDTFMCDFRV